MSPVIKNFLAGVGGIIAGSVVNMGIIMLLSKAISAPQGVDVTNAESIKANMHLYKAQHFVAPFLAHGLGTLVGAYIAARFAATHHKMMALLIGVVFLAGGISMAFQIPAPTWFVIADLVLAYIPMALLGYKLAGKRKDVLRQ